MKSANEVVEAGIPDTEAKCAGITVGNPHASGLGSVLCRQCAVPQSTG
jgi:hypothetical protein